MVYLTENKKMIERIEWEEFRKSGLLWFVNRILHFFGVAICFEYDDESHALKDVFPARCKFRGFSAECETEGFKELYKFMKINLPEISRDILDEEDV